MKKPHSKKKKYQIKRKMRRITKSGKKRRWSTSKSYQNKLV